MAEHDHQHHHDHHAQMVADFRRRFFVSLVLSVPVLVLAPMLQEWAGVSFGFPGDRLVSFALAAVIYVYGGWPFLKGLWQELAARTPGMMTLVALAISVAFLYSLAVLLGLEGRSLLWELVTLVDVMLLGHWIEMRSVMGASRALEELAKLMPGTAMRLREDGSTEEVRIEELAVGERVLVRPGEKVPVDGVVVDGRSAVNESLITGETKPVEKEEGSEVIGGAINGDGSLTVRIEKLGKDSYLASVMQLVADAQAQRSATQNLANRAAMWLTYVAIGGGVITFTVWQFMTGVELAYALERTIAVVVIACPHALGLAIPLVVAFSTALSARNGLLIRNRTAFEGARKIDAVLFDKTGTLTQGAFGVSDVLPLADASREDVLRLAGAIEAHSEHPIAKAIAEAADRTSGVDNFEALPGRGAKGMVGGHEVLVVSPGYLRDLHGEIDNKAVQAAQDAGKTVVYILRDGVLLGAIALDDVVRPEAHEAVARLKGAGIEPMMLTGDADAVAARVAGELGITTYFAEVRPDEKAQKVTEVQQAGHFVAMVGDGVNDAPALATADVGIAIGAGTDVAVETADIVLVRSDPRDVATVIELGRRTHRKMVQNLWWASGYNIVALPLAGGVLAGVGIVLSPAFGAVLMSLSTVIVAANAMLLRRTPLTDHAPA